MEKNYTEIEFCGGCTIESAVNELLEFKNKGTFACGTFNGTVLYSDSVTIEKAYIDITGQTKAQCEENSRKWKEDYERKKKEHTENIPSLTEEWINKGHEVLLEDKWELWDKIVPIRLGDLYYGMELGCCLDIVKILNDGGELDEAKAMINGQDHSGASFSLVRAMVKEFSARGLEFAEYVN
jgi:hypothetical protein